MLFKFLNRCKCKKQLMTFLCISHVIFKLIRNKIIVCYFIFTSKCEISFPVTFILYIIDKFTSKLFIVNKCAVIIIKW